MRNFQIYLEFQIFDLRDLFFGYGHSHISGSLNIFTNIFLIFFVRPFSSMIIRNMIIYSVMLCFNYQWLSISLIIQVLNNIHISNIKTFIFI